MDYTILIILGISLFVYTLSYIFTKTRYLSFPDHRRIWNYLLLFSFILAGGTGILMAITDALEFPLSGKSTWKDYHVRFGTVWFVIAFFHFIWHLKYFKKAGQKILGIK